MLPTFKTGFQTSFRFKLFVIFTVLTLLITLTFSVVYIRSEINSQKKRAEQRLNLLATHLSGNISLPLFAENHQMMKQILNEQTVLYPDISAIMVRNKDNRILVDFARTPTVRPENELTKTVDVISNPLGISPEEAMTGSSPTTVTAIGSMQLSLDISDMTAKIRELTYKALVIAFFFWVAVSLLSYLVLQKVTQGFKTFLEGLETIKAGNYSISIPVLKNDEPGRAAAAVNELAAALRRRDEDNRRLQEELVHALKMEVQEEKKQLMAKLIQTNRMTFLGLLASSMAHEINNPNGSIRLAGLYLSRAWLDALPLLKRTAEEEGDFSLGGIPFSAASREITSCCATIERNTELISKVVHDLRSYSLGERYEFNSDVNVNQVIYNAISTVRAYGRHGDMQVVVETEADLPLIYGSRHQLEQVVINLLLNALQALPDGTGTVTITSSLKPESSQVAITISDQGGGIAPKDLEHLFEPFYSTRLDKGGSGLGLFVTNFLVSQHQGTLDFSSELGKGTTVTVNLPLP